jgi:hypothetical protein
MAVTFDQDMTIFPPGSGAGGGGGLTPVAVSADATASDGQFLFVTTGAATILITPPPPASGARFGVKKVDNGAGKVRIVQTVEGVVNPVIFVQYQELILISDGSDWWVEGT